MKPSFKGLINKMSFSLVILTTVLTSHANDNTIRIVTSTSEHFSPAALMPEFCKKYNGLDISVSQKPSAVYDASVGGIALLERKEADIASMTLASGLIAKANGVKISPIASMASNGIDLIVNDNIKNYSDLKGKTLGQLKGSSTQLQIAKKLEDAGLTLSDVKFIYMSYGQMPLAFQNKSIDGFVGSYPHTLLGITAGGKSIDNFPDVIRPLWASDSLDVDLASRFKKCHSEFMKFLQDSKNKNIIQQMVENIKHTGNKVYLPNHNKYSYSLDSRVDKKTINDTITFLISEKKIRADFKFISKFE